MKAHITAITALLAPLGWPVYYGDATPLPPAKLSWPYVLLWGSPGWPSSEAALADTDTLEDLLGVTTVDTTAGNVLTVVPRVRALLDGARPAVQGRHVRLHRRPGMTGPVLIDRDVKLPGGGHPAYQADRYLLVSEPDWR